jgi:hypothetical protein
VEEAEQAVEKLTVAKKKKRVAPVDEKEKKKVR